jgi:hypothetical protein
MSGDGVGVGVDVGVGLGIGGAMELAKALGLALALWLTWATALVPDRAAFGLDRKRNYQLFCFQVNS